jgi:hypothetical protein
MVETLANHPPATVVAWLPAWSRGAKQLCVRTLETARQRRLVLEEGDRGRPAFLGPIGVFLIGFVRLRIHLPSDLSQIVFPSGWFGSSRVIGVGRSLCPT